MTAKPTIRVLIVDDCEEDRETYRRLIQRDDDVDYLFAEAETGTEGLAVCCSEPPDCVLLDYRLPDIDGLVVLTKLLGGTRGVPLPVVMLTGAAESDLGLEAVRRGAQDFLIKGETGSGALVTAIRHAVERHRWFEDQARRRAWRERNLSARADLFRASLHGLAPVTGEPGLRDRDPEAYKRAEKAYLELTETALAGKTFEDAGTVSTGLVSIARELAALNAGPREVLDLHVASLTRLAAAAVTPAAASGDDARLMALELMGHLVAEYRSRTGAAGTSEKTDAA